MYCTSCILFFITGGHAIFLLPKTMRNKYITISVHLNYYCLDLTKLKEYTYFILKADVKRIHVYLYEA